MFPQWGYTIPVSVFMLGACSVYDSSLLTTSPIVQGGAGGAAGAAVAGVGASSFGASSNGGREADSEAGEAGLSNDVGGGGANAGSGAVSGSEQGGAGGAAGTASAGHGGTSGGAGAGVVLALETIDTMEDHDGAIDHTGTRNGDWYAGHDATATGVQTPGSTFTMTALPTTDSRYSATDQWAAMTKGMGFNDWGEDLGFNMMLVPVGEMYHPPYDATPYCGLHFFARVGVGASSTVIVRVPDKNSLPDGGVCSSSGAMPCYAYFQKVYSFNTTWTEYNVLFSDLRSTGWPTALAQNAIFSVEFGLASKSVFELWIDDISFLKKPVGGVCPLVYP
jgi:hypothetical protein